MFVKSQLFKGLCLAGVLLLSASSTSYAQSARVKIGNRFGSDVQIKSIAIDCKDWACTPPSFNGVFGRGDSLDLEFTSVNGNDELVTVRLETAAGVIETQQMLRVAGTASVEAESAQLFVSPVWPNPAKDNLSFNVHGMGSRELNAYIYDLQGKEIFARRVDRDGAITLNLPAMPEGRYYFMLRDGVETLTMQEIKVSAN